MATLSTDSPVSPLTSIAPLSFMVLVTAVKQGYEDWLRHKSDNKVNRQMGELPPPVGCLTLMRLTPLGFHTLQPMYANKYHASMTRK